MVNELLQLSPIQFIEGINENKEPIEPDEGRFWHPRDLQVAIPYKPNRTYTINRIYIFGSPDELPTQEKHLVRLYTNSGDVPSENYITEGELVIPAEVGGEDWLQIELQPVVLFRKEQYWIVVEDYSPRFAFGRAKDGDEVNKTGRRRGHRWITIEDKMAFMVKFYGRVLPVVT